MKKNEQIFPGKITGWQSLQTFIQTHRRWGIVALLFLTAVINSLDRQTLSVLAPTLKEKMGFGAEEYSYIITAFLVAYTLGYTFCGRVLDRKGVKVGLAIALMVWSFASISHGLATGWISLAVCRFLLGLGESFNSPAGVKAVVEWVPPRERGLSMAVFSNGNVIGALIAPALVAVLTLYLGWRWAFFITGGIGFLLLFFWWQTYDTPEKHSRLSVEERNYILSSRNLDTPVVKGVSMLQLLRHPLCIGFFLIRFFTDSITFFLHFWLPDYLQHVRGFSLAMIGMVGWIPFLAADIGGPAGGALSDWLVRRGWPAMKARRTLMFVAACLSPLALVAVRTELVWLAVALIAVILAAQACWMTNQLTLISESVSRENVASMLSLSAIGGSLGGILSTLMAGRLVASVGYIPVFTGLGFLHLTAFIILAIATWKGGGKLMPVPVKQKSDPVS